MSHTKATGELQNHRNKGRQGGQTSSLYLSGQRSLVPLPLVNSYCPPPVDGDPGPELKQWWKRRFSILSGSHVNKRLFEMGKDGEIEPFLLRSSENTR